MYYILNRKGTIYPLTNSTNQCRSNGYGHYHYHVVLVSDKLDKLGFVVDNKELDQVIQSCPALGSCEEVSKAIFDHVRTIKGMKQNLIAYKSRISPHSPEHEAFMDFMWHKPDSFTAFQLACSLQI